MKKYIPFPIDLSHYKEVRELTCAQFGILIRIIEGFWKTGEELGKNDYTLYHAIRCPYKLWAMSKGTVFKALNVVMPDIIEARKRLVGNRQKLSINAQKGQAALRIKRIRVIKNFYDENENKKLIIPAVPKNHEETAWNKGQFDPIMRKMALKSNEENKGKNKLFYDKPKE